MGAAARRSSTAQQGDRRHRHQAGVGRMGELFVRLPRRTLLLVENNLSDVDLTNRVIEKGGVQMMSS